MNKLKEKYYIALGNLQNMAIDNTKGSKGVNICVLDINEYVAYLQSKIDKAIEYIEKDTRWFDYEYASVYGELCDCEGYNANRLEVMVNPSNVLNILKEDK